MAKITDQMGRPHSGLVQNAVVGIVTDNVDPDELGRIQVKFPTLHNEPLSFWLRQISPMAGKERGLYALPEPDDEVLVMFMQGSQDVGVILGQFWNGVDIPPQECKDAMPVPGDTDTGAEWSVDQYTDGSKSLDKNDRRFWKSRSGHLLVFDDTDGSESVQIWDKDHNLAFIFDPNEQRILLSNTKGDIHIRTKKDLYIEAGQNIKVRAGMNIEGQSDMDTSHHAKMNISTDSDMDTTMTAEMNWKSEAKMNWDGKASMNATLQASMNTTVKGGISTTVQGGASTTVKAAVVLIN